MKLSTRGRYGLRMMLDLALYRHEPQVPLAAIAARQEVSARYLEQVAGELRKAGYIRSIKGAQGGYLLAVEPKALRVGDILRLLEGDVRLTDEPADDESPLARTVREAVFDPLNRQVEELVDSMTLQDLIDEHERRNGASMYYI